MARQPDIQYIQMYNYGSTARELAPQRRMRKEKYQLPEQRPQKAKARQKLIDPLSVCAMAVAGVMLVAMLVGMFKVGELSSRRMELQNHIDTLQEQRVELQKAYEEAYDLHQVEVRARQIGMVYGDEAVHVQMGKVTPEADRNPGIWEQMTQIVDELFAKAPR